MLKQEKNCTPHHIKSTDEHLCCTELSESDVGFYLNQKENEMNVIINKSAKNVDKDSTLKLGDTLITYGEPVNVSMSQYAIATDSDMLEIEVVQFDSNEKEVVKEDILANIVLEEVDVYDVIMCQINDKMGATSGQQPSIDSVAIASLEVYKEVKKRVYESQNEINITGGIIGS